MTCPPRCFRQSIVRMHDPTESACLLYGNCFVNLLHAVRDSPPRDPQERKPIPAKALSSCLLYKFIHFELSSSSFFTTVRVQYLTICFSTKYSEFLKLLFNLTSIFLHQLMHRIEKREFKLLMFHYLLALPEHGKQHYMRD
jgi:hypothetical protein